jgi:hypothetical protein
MAVTVVMELDCRMSQVYRSESKVSDHTLTNYHSSLTATLTAFHMLPILQHPPHNALFYPSQTA